MFVSFVYVFVKTIKIKNFLFIFKVEQLKSHPDIREKLFVAAKESHGNFLNRNCINSIINQHHHNQQHDLATKLCHNDHKNLNLNNSNNLSVFGSSNSDDKNSQRDTLINEIINNYYNNHNHHNVNHDAMLIMGSEEAAQHLVWCASDSQSNFSSASECPSCTEEEDRDWLDYPTRFLTQFNVLSSRNFKEAKPRMLSKLNWFQVCMKK